MGRMWRRRMADHCGLLRTLSKKDFACLANFRLDSGNSLINSKECKRISLHHLLPSPSLRAQPRKDLTPMSEFGNMIRSLAPAKASVREIATRVDIDATNLSRILTASDGRAVHSETLSRICLGLTPSREKQAELNAAYLRDLRIPSLANLIEIKVSKGGHGKTKKNLDPENPAHVLASIAERLDPASARALCQIAQNLDYRPLRRAILSLGEIAAAGRMPEK